MKIFLICLFFLNTSWAGFPRGDVEILYKNIVSFKDLSYAIYSLSADPTVSGVSATQGSLGMYTNDLYIKDSGSSTNWTKLQRELSAGSGINISGAYVISTDSSVVQARVTGTCPAGSSIRVIDGSGGVTCETDDGGTDTNAGTICAAGEYLDGDGSCYDIPVTSVMALPHRWNEYWLETLDVRAGYCAAITGGSCSVGPPTDTIDATYPNGLLIRSGTTANGGGRISSVQIDLDKFGTVSHKFMTIARYVNTTNVTSTIGFLDSLLTTGSNGAYITVVGTTASCVTENGGSTTTHGTTYTITTGTTYIFDIEVNAAGSNATCSIYASSGGTALWSVSNTTNIPTSNPFGWTVVARESTTSVVDLMVVKMIGVGTIEGFNAKRSW